jgi:ADP-heptose:LPS heptosyltransferase
MQRSAPQTILLIRAGALGDCLLMLPTLHALRAHFPQSRIDVMGYPPRWEWALGRGLVDAVHSIERPGMHLLFGEGLEVPGHLKAFLGTYDVILSYRPDPDGVFKRNLEALGRPLVLSQSPFPPQPPPKVHVADFALQLVAQLGVSVAPTTSGLSLSEAELALSLPFFTRHEVDPARQPLVVVHPGSGSPAKRWPVENFVTLIETLEDQLGVRTVVVTGYAETDVLVRLRSLIRAATPLVAEDWPLLQTASVIAHARVFVGHDSGLTHLAAALGRPTVALFGPTDPDIWKPRGEHVTVVSMTRADAGDHEHDPARGISPASHSDLRQVVEAVRYWLAAETARPSPGARSVPL